MRGVFCREKEFRGGQTLFFFLFFSQYIFYLADKERDVFTPADGSEDSDCFNAKTFAHLGKVGFQFFRPL